LNNSASNYLRKRKTCSVFQATNTKQEGYYAQRTVGAYRDSCSSGSISWKRLYLDEIWWGNEPLTQLFSQQRCQRRGADLAFDS